MRKNISIDKKRKYISGGVAAMAMSVAACTAGVSAQDARNVDEAAKYNTKLIANEETVDDVETTEASEETVSEEELMNKLSTVSVEAKDVYKDETVYAFADPTGKTTEVLVNEVLKNKDGSATLTDKTDLTDIENVKGDETFTVDGDTITWQANGNDITYQGKSNKELPVTVKVSYYLNGTEVKPEEIAGKSGKVKIRFDYTNNATVVKEINGRNEDINVPFVAVTGMVLPEKFTNITVTNGKCLAQGESNIVVGFGMPGLMDSIKASDADFAEDVDVPDFFEVEADVENFSLDMTATIVMDGSAMNLAGEVDLDDLDEMIGSLSDATAQLVDGTGQLSDGVATLLEKMGQFNTGVGTLKSGIDTLSSKSTALVTGIGTIDASANSISTAISTLDKALNTPMSDDAKSAAYQQAYTAASSAAGQAIDAQAADIATAAATTVDATFKAEGGSYDTIKATVDGSIDAMLNDEEVKAQIASDVSSATTTAVTGYVSGQLQAVAADPSSNPELAATYQALVTYYSGLGVADPAGAAQTAIAKIAGGAGKAAAYAAAGAVQNDMTDVIEEANMGTVVADTCADVATTVAKQVSVSSAKQAATNAAGQAAGAAAIQGAESAKAQIAGQIEAVQANGYSLVTGAAALAAGTSTITANIPALTDGILALQNGAATLANGSSLLVDGVSTLNDGAVALKDGMQQYDTQAISKIVNSYNGDVKSLVERLAAVASASTEYDTFTMHEDNVAATTKFIIKTAGIEAAN